MHSVSCGLYDHCPNSLYASLGKTLIGKVVSARIDVQKSGQARFTFIRSQDDGKRVTALIHRDDPRAKRATSVAAIPDSEFVEVPIAAAEQERDEAAVQSVQAAVAEYFGCEGPAKPPRETANPAQPKGTGNDLAQAIAAFMDDGDDYDYDEEPEVDDD